MLVDLQMIEAIAPDILQDIQERYRILQNIYWMQPIGRRNLAENLELTERVLRTETDLLKKLDLIATSKSGMRLTKQGETVYEQLGKLMDQLFGMQQLEKRVALTFGIERCLVIDGDSDRQKKIVEEFGATLNDALNNILPEGQNIIAVMGGTTMAVAAKQITSLKTSKRKNLFVPARGGIGESVNLQANSVSAEMAIRAHGEYRTLYVPEQLSPATYDSLLKEPSIVEVLELINQSNCVVHSIGRALHMAARRKMSEKEILMLKQKNAVAESFGYFFDEAGKVVYKVPSVGLQLKGIRNVPYVFAIAGGKSKAKAIRAYLKNAPRQTWLITDAAAAKQILKGVTL